MPKSDKIIDEDNSIDYPKSMSANAVCAIKTSKCIIVIQQYKLCKSYQVIVHHDNRQVLDKSFVQCLDCNMLLPDMVPGQIEE